MTAPVYQQYPQQFPVQQPWPQQSSAPQFAQPQQQFAPGYPPATQAAPAVPLAQGSIDDFYSQPSTGGGAALKFEAVGTSYTGIVTRPVTSADIQQQTDIQGKPQFFRDGRPKFVMKVPLQLQPTADRPDGLAQWFVKGQARDELVRAMAEAGAAGMTPEPGAIITITYTGQRPSGPGMNPAKQFHVTYVRPTGEASSPAPQAAAQQPVVQPQVAQQPAVQQPVAPQVPAQQPVAQAQPAAPADLTPEQQALLARLTGAQG